MPKRATIGELVVYPAKGGLETYSIPGTTTIGRLASGSNFMVDINGAKKKMPGAIKQNIGALQMAPTGNARSLFDFWRTTGNIKTRRTVFGASGKYYADFGDGIYTDITGAFSILQTDNTSIDTFFGLMIIAFTNNPGGGPLKWNQIGNLASLGGSPPNAKYVRTWYNRLWAAGVGTAPDRLYGSVPNNPEDWSTINGAEIIDLDQGDQDPVGITSLFPPFYGRLMVAKRRSIYEVIPVGDTFGIQTLISGLGCVSHGGAASTDSDIIFPSERGISSLAMTNKLGALDSNFLSASIQDYYQGTVSFESAANMRSLYVPELNSYLLSYTSTSSTNNDIVLGYNFALGEWYQWDENVSAMCYYVDPNDQFKTKVMVGNDKGQIGVLDIKKNGRTVTWFGERTTMQFATGIIFPLPNKREATFRKITVYYKPSVEGSVLNVSYFVNAKFIDDLEFDMSPIHPLPLIGSAIVGVDRIGTNGRIKHVTKNIHGVGEAIELVFTHTPISDEDDCEIYGFVIEYEYAGETDLPKQQ